MQDQKPLFVYSASAGSGKTFTIANEYVAMMLTGGAYRDILAVTFTNKACEEMKSRIIKNLFLISKVDDLKGKALKETQDKIEDIEKKSGLSCDRIKGGAKVFFAKIIHDYSFFSVFTIDSFFQKIVRNLTYELDLQQNFELELQTEIVIAQLVDDIMLMAETDKDLNGYICYLIDDNIENSRKWSPKNVIKNFVAQAISADYKGFDGNIDDYKEALDKIISDYCRQFKQYVDDVSDLISGVDVGKISKKNGGEYFYYNKYKKYCDSFDFNEAKLSNFIFDSYKKPADNRWFNKYELVESALQEKSDELASNYKNFCTAYIIRKNIPLLYLHKYANAVLHENLERDSIFLLSDVPSILSRIIGVNDGVMPFVFEKVGTTYSHYMIDEFQDTSRKQWDIFYTMLEDVLASVTKGRSSIIVGDIKQSIYSWRGGDWTILSDLASGKVFKDYLETNNLKKNFRTAKNIVNFNSDFFKEEYDKNVDDLFGSNNGLLYADVFQEYNQDVDSEIKIRLYNSTDADSIDNTKDAIFRDMLSEIDSLLDRGVLPSQITILVRKSKEAEFITNSFLAIEGKNYDVVSNEALFIRSNPAVKIILAYMRYLLNPDNELVHIEAAYLYYLHNGGSVDSFDKKTIMESLDNSIKGDDNVTLSNKQSFEIVEILISRLKLNTKKNVPFLIAFRNEVHDFSDKSTDLQAFIEYWDERGSDATLKIPENQNAIKILTIHKSKGLESDYIFIPFCNWEFASSNGGGFAEYMFVNNTIEGFENTVVPIKCTSDLEKTDMAELYRDSKYGEAIESYNLLYVAFTRAKYGLYVSSLIKPKERNRKVSSLIEDYFSIEREGWIYDTIENEDYVCRVMKTGTLGDKIDKAKQDASDDAFISEYPIHEKINVEIVRHLKDDIDGSAESRIIGTKYHAVFEKIIDISDVDSVLAMLFDNGEIDFETRQNISSELNVALKNENIRHFYDGSGIVYNEFNIIDSDSSSDRLKRPDRVVVFPDKGELAVIDYKFGEEERKKYVDQVLDYSSLISKMENFKNMKVSAYIWYYFLHKLVKVDLSGKTTETKL